jgi:hypothetical protein
MLIGAAVLAAATVLTTAVVAAPAPAVVTSGKSTFVMHRTDATTCTNWGRYGVFHVGANALSVRRGLVSFELPKTPRGRSVVSATLSVHRPNALRGSGTVGVHRVTRAWSEGSGVNTCTNDGATWPLASPGSPWATAGGDFDPAPLATVVKQAGEAPGWDSFDLTALVRAWSKGTAANHGVLLKLADESFSPCTTVENCNYWAYSSDDATDVSLRPTLTIAYS